MRVRCGRCAWVVVMVGGLILGNRVVLAQAKRETADKSNKDMKGLSLKEARRLALENNYDVAQLKKQLVDKKITRLSYDAAVAGIMADVEEAYMNLYVAREALQLARKRAARGSTRRGAVGKSDFKPPASPEVAEQEKLLAQARQLAEFIPLEKQVKLYELQLKALMNTKAYPLKSDEEIVLTDRPAPMKRDIDVDALVEKALERQDRMTALKGRGARPDRSAADMDHERKRITFNVRRAALNAEASIKRLEIAQQVLETQKKRLQLLQAAKADPSEIQAAQDAVDDAALEELRAIVSNNSDLMALGRITGTLARDLGLESGD